MASHGSQYETETRRRRRARRGCGGIRGEGPVRECGLVDAIPDAIARARRDRARARIPAPVELDMFTVTASNVKIIAPAKAAAKKAESKAYVRDARAR